jgi:hypothetical protein
MADRLNIEISGRLVPLLLQLARRQGRGPDEITEEAVWRYLKWVSEGTEPGPGIGRELGEIYVDPPEEPARRPSAHVEEFGESEETAGHPNEPASYGKKSQLELVRRRVLLEDLSQEDIDRFERFLTITPSEWGSGSSDVSINHDRHLFED